MALPQFQRPLSFDEAIDATYRAALDGQAVSDAAREFAHQVDDRDIYELVARGLAEHVHDRLGRMRTAQRGGTEVDIESDAKDGPAPAKAKPHYAKQAFELLRESNYEAADGTRKSLIRFNLDDWRHLYNDAGSKAAGWARIRDAADRAISAMQQHSAATTADLPAAEKRAIQARLA